MAIHHAKHFIIRKTTATDLEQVATIHVAGWQENYKGIIEQEYLDAISYEKRLEMRRTLYENNSEDIIRLVAECDGKVVGFCETGPSFANSSEYKGEIDAIYVSMKYKNVGIGKEFMKVAAAHLKTRLLIPYIVQVLKENTSARKFYERCGGVFLEEKLSKVGEKEYPLVTYIFREKVLV